MICDLLPFVRPMTRNGNVAIAHFTIVWIVPTTKGVGTDDIAILIRYVNRFACGKGFVYFVWLSLYIGVAIDWQDYVCSLRDIFSAPIIGNLVICDLLPFVRPTTRNGNVAIAHYAIVWIVPTAKGVDTVDIVVVVPSGYLGIFGVFAIHRIGLTLHVDIVINRHIFAGWCATPAVGNTMACYGQLWRFVQAFA